VFLITLKKLMIYDTYSNDIIIKLLQYYDHY
jgi:hypothetical protein